MSTPEDRDVLRKVDVAIAQNIVDGLIEPAGVSDSGELMWRLTKAGREKVERMMAETRRQRLEKGDDDEPDQSPD